MTSDDLGPLPTYSSERQLEERSFKLLNLLLPESMFVVRDHRPTDFGIDGSLELVEQSHPTGCLFMFQLKARSGLESNADGSLSVSLDSQNVNYLLNSESAIVILYDVDTGTFRWISVVDAVRRLTAEEIDYREQKTVTFRMSRRLHDATLGELHAHLRDNRRSRRRLREQIASLAAGAQVHVDGTGAGKTSAEVASEFFATGWTLASEGELSKVERLHGLLAAEVRDAPRARLLLAYANHCKGRPVATLGQVVETSRRGSELDADEQDLLALLRAQSDFYVGRLSKVGLVAAEEAVHDRAAPSTRVQLAVQTLRHELGEHQDVASVANLALRVRALAGDAERKLGPRHPGTLGAHLLALEVAGHVLVLEYIHFMLILRHDDGGVGLLMRGGKRKEEAVREMSNKLDAWDEAIARITKECSRWSMLELEGHHARLFVSVCVLRNDALFEAIADVAEDGSPARDAKVAGFIHDIETLRSRAVELGMDDAEARARLLLLDALDVARLHERRGDEAASLVAYCDLHGFKPYRANAQSHLDGRSSLRNAFAEIATEKQRGPDDEILARSTPEDRERVAREMHSFMGLPQERLAVIRDVTESMAVVQELQITWCRHLEIVENQEHLRSPETIYAAPPARRCTCDATGNASAIPSPDWRTVIEAFRKVHCTDCRRREPKEAR